MDAVCAMMALLRLAICGENTPGLRETCTEELLEQVYTLAAHHDLAHLIGQSVSRLELPDSEPVKKSRQAAMVALYRNIRMEGEYTQICDTLEQAEIPFIPLKGSVLRKFYPESWMRTSCDMDILVQEADLETASRVLQDTLHYIYEGKTSHDIALRAPGGDHLELHYSLIEDFVSSPSEEILSHVWEKATALTGKTYHRELPDTLFYYYHMAHMAKHFVHGGCGVRPFLDVWVLNNRVEYDAAARNALLRQGGLLQFSEGAETLSGIWFSGAEHDAMSQSMEQFVLTGGTYGSMKNRVTVNQAKVGGKTAYALGRIFLPYDVIKHYYPVLQKHKWLMPVYQVVRWCKLLFCGGIKRSVKELQTNATVSQEKEYSTAQLLQHLGLYRSGEAVKKGRI